MKGVLVLILFAALACARFDLLKGNIVEPKQFRALRTSGKSTLYEVEVENSTYDRPPLLLQLRGSRQQIGYDYAALLAVESADTIDRFIKDVAPKSSDAFLLFTFIDWCWDHWLGPHSPSYFHEELAGMQQWYAEHGDKSLMAPHTVAHRFYTLANLPADTQNIIAMLENEFEQGLPDWLKGVINDLVKILEKIIHSCDAYGVWGSRTSEHGAVWSSRNLDYQSNTGINRHKLVVVYNIDGVQPYASVGFAFGLGALAGVSRHTSVSEMNLDNSVVTFEGVPFPLRLRMVLEQATDLESALSVWSATNNTNSFNFLIASSVDNQAVALETIAGYTGVFHANSPVEAAAFFPCGHGATLNPTCHKWTTQTGDVRIGFPLPDAVWRSNHGMNPKVMSTQENLFNNTVFRYNLMHSIFQQLAEEKSLVNDQIAVNIVASLGIKGPNYLTCDQKFHGDNVMSMAYAPRAPGANTTTRVIVAWEAKSDAAWLPAACATFVRFDLEKWFAASQ